jgi:molecular chaperone GrpE
MPTLKDRFAHWSRSRNPQEDSPMNTETPIEDLNVNETPEGDLGAAPEIHVVESTELEQLRGERDQLVDRLARLQAEFDNARKRESKERQDVRDYATQAAVEPFLGVMDNFGLALSATGDVAQLRTGVELIVKQMDEALRSLNVQPVESVGVQFDPRVHEALGSIETVEHPDHQVLEEIRRGYKLRDKLLRPALVRIADNSAQKSE